MPNLLIITRNVKTYSHSQLMLSAKKLGVSCDTLRSDNFCGLPELLNYDLVLMRDSGISYDDIDLTIAQYLQNKDLRIINSLETIKSLRGKDNQFIFFKKHGLPHIPTLLSRGDPSAELIEKYLPGQPEFILKTIRGNQGRGVMLLKGLDSALSVIESNFARKDERYLLQPRLSFKKEYRVLLLGGEILGTIEKTPLEDFRANAKRSDTKITKVIPSEVENLVKKIQKILPGQFLGLDIGIAENEPVIIEINTTSGFEEFDKLHGTSVAQKLLETYL